MGGGRLGDRAIEGSSGSPAEAASRRANECTAAVGSRLSARSGVYGANWRGFALLPPLYFSSSCRFTLFVVLLSLYSRLEDSRHGAGRRDVRAGWHARVPFP